MVDNTSETATCVVAALGGRTSQTLSDYVINTSEIKKYAGPTFGGLGLEFLVRCGVNAAMLQAMAMVRPEDNRSMLYEIAYYAGDQKLINSAVALAQFVVGKVQQLLSRPPPPAAATAANARTVAGGYPAKKSEDCACKH